MKLLFLILLLTTMLFSQQRQIILGCYINEENAQKEIEKLNELMVSDSKLKKLVERDSLKGELKKVGDYNVITLSHFDTYGQLFLGIDILKAIYDDAYVLDYPFTKKIISEKFIAPKEEVVVLEAKEKKTEDEIVIKDEPVVEEEEVITEEVEKEVIPKVEEVVKAEPIVEAEVIKEPVKIEKAPEKVVIEEPQIELIKKIKPKVKPQDLIKNEPLYEEEVVTKEVVEENNYMIYGLVIVVVLLLIAMGLFLYTRGQKEEVNEWDFKS